MKKYVWGVTRKQKLAIGGTALGSLVLWVIVGGVIVAHAPIPSPSPIAAAIASPSPAPSPVAVVSPSPLASPSLLPSPLPSPSPVAKPSPSPVVKPSPSPVAKSSPTHDPRAPYIYRLTLPGGTTVLLTSFNPAFYVPIGTLKNIGQLAPDGSDFYCFSPDGSVGVMSDGGSALSIQHAQAFCAAAGWS
jgi:hypothetical protein